MILHYCFHCNTLDIYIVDVHNPTFQKEYTVVFLWPFLVFMLTVTCSSTVQRNHIFHFHGNMFNNIHALFWRKSMASSMNMPQCYVTCILSILLSMTSFNTYQLAAVHQQWIHLQRDVQRVSVSVTVPQALTHPTAALGG